MKIGNCIFIYFINSCHWLQSTVEIIIYLLSVTIGYSDWSGTSLHQIGLLNIAYPGERVALYPRFDIVGLPIRVD